MKVAKRSMYDAFTVLKDFYYLVSSNKEINMNIYEYIYECR